MRMEVMLTREPMQAQVGESLAKVVLIPSSHLAQDQMLASLETMSALSSLEARMMRRRASSSLGRTKLIQE